MLYCWMLISVNCAEKKLFNSIVNEITDNTRPRWIRIPEKLCDNMNRLGQVKTSPRRSTEGNTSAFSLLSLSLSLFSFGLVHLPHRLYKTSTLFFKKETTL